MFIIPTIPCSLIASFGLGQDYIYVCVCVMIYRYPTFHNRRNHGLLTSCSATVLTAPVTASATAPGAVTPQTPRMGFPMVSDQNAYVPKVNMKPKR